MANLLRIDFIISGKVQGVGYRYFVKEKAESLNIKGHVKNKKDGSVYVAAQGESGDLENLLKFCYHGPPLAIVRNIEKSQKPLANFAGFSIDS